MWMSLLIAIGAAIPFWLAANAASCGCFVKAVDSPNQTPSKTENTSASPGTDTSQRT